MANMDDTTTDLSPATPVFGGANAPQTDEDLVWEHHFTAPGVPMNDCAACNDKVSQFHTMRAPCGHTYCRICVKELFDRAAKHEINFPPKCCDQVITLEEAGLFLSLDIYDKFQEKSEEFSTINRTYCSDPECVTFIPPKAIDNQKAKCPACQKLTCIACKAKAHEGDCPEDPAVQSLLTTAAEAGFQQCRQCKRMIDLIDGCHHITCICGAEFCYLCGAKWKTCGCDGLADEEFDERENQEMFDLAVQHIVHIHDYGLTEWDDGSITLI